MKLMKFHKYLSGIILRFHSVAMYFVDSQFPFWYFWKMTGKISVSLKQIWNFKVLNLAMAKVEKVNITVT